MKQEGQQETVADDLYAVLEATRWIALLLAPLLPDLSARMLDQLAQEPLSASGPWLERLNWGLLEPMTPLPEPTPVMGRLELEDPL